MIKLAYRPGKGWFRIVEFLTGTVDFYTGVALPDRYGCYQRRWIVGPYATAREAYDGPA